MKKLNKSCALLLAFVLLLAILPINVQASSAQLDNMVKIAENENGIGRKNKQGRSYVSDEPWCANFVKWCAVQVNASFKGYIHSGCSKTLFGGWGGTKGLLASSEEIHFSNAFFEDLSVGTNRQRKRLPRYWKDGYVPAKGDIIFFYDIGESEGNYCDAEVVQHIGIVTSVDKNAQKVYTIEGNVGSSSVVGARNYYYGPNVNRSGRQILAFWKPKYSQTTTPPITSGSEYVVVGGGLNVRSGPSTSYSQLTQIPTGTIVGVTNISNGWGKVTYNGKTGYIMLNYTLQITKVSESRRVINGALNLRAEPSTTSVGRASIPSSTQISVTRRVTNKSGELWGYTNYNGVNGWVMLKFTA